MKSSRLAEMIMPGCMMAVFSPLQNVKYVLYHMGVFQLSIVLNLV